MTSITIPRVAVSRRLAESLVSKLPENTFTATLNFRNTVVLNKDFLKTLVRLAREKGVSLTVDRDWAVLTEELRALIDTNNIDF